MGEGRAGVVLASVAAISAAVAALAGTWQAWIAHDAERRQLRAYLYVDHAPMQFGEDVASTKITIRHFGSTPAQDVRIFGFLTAAPMSISTPLDDPETLGGWPRYELVALFGKEIKRDFNISGAAVKNITREGSSIAIYLRGVVLYRDVFSEAHRQNFCFTFTPKRPEGSQDGCRAEHNQAD